jgi:hypothetical protein
MTKDQANRIHNNIKREMAADLQDIRAADEALDWMREAFERKLAWAVYRQLHEPMAVWWEEEGRFRASCGYRRKVTPECACPDERWNMYEEAP